MAGPDLRSSIRNRLLVLVCGGVAVVGLFQLLFYGYGRDQGIYAAVADAMIHGGAPYQEAWDFKPPGIFFVFALARLLGTAEYWVRIIEALAWLSLVGAYGRLSQRWLGSFEAGVVSGLLAFIIHVQLEFWHTAQPESFAAVALAWAMVLGSSELPSRRRQLAAWAGAGACYGIAALMKPPLGGGILVAGALLAVRGYRAATTRRAGAALVPVLAMGAGSLAAIGLVLAYFAAHGALFELHDTLFVFTPRYTAIGFSWRKVFETYYNPAFTDVIAGYSALNLVGCLLLAGLRPRVSLHALILVAGNLFFAVTAVALQQKFFVYHSAPALALCALLAGWGFFALWQRVGAGIGARAAVALLIPALIAVHPAMRFIPGRYFERVRTRMRAVVESSERRQRMLDRLDSAGDVDQVAVREAARWVSQSTPPDARVYVWGFAPQLYLFAGRRPATRYIYNVPQRAAWAQDAHRPVLMADLARHAPAVVLVEKGDSFSWVTGNAHDSAQALHGFPELNQLLGERYERAGGNRKFDYYRRRR